MTIFNRVNPFSNVSFSFKEEMFLLKDQPLLELRRIKFFQFRVISIEGIYLYTLKLTQFQPVDLSILIIRTSPFLVLGVSGGWVVSFLVLL